MTYEKYDVIKIYYTPVTRTRSFIETIVIIVLCAVFSFVLFPSVRAGSLLLMWPPLKTSPTL